MVSSAHTIAVELDLRDGRLSGLVGPNPVVRRVATGFAFLEGPVWHASTETLILSDIIGNTLYRWSSRDGVAVFRHPSNMANGNTLDRDGRLLTCEHATSRVTRTDLSGSIEVLASHYHGKELNSPNDIVVASSGAIYFTDPTSGRTARYGVERPQELSFQGVYRIDPDRAALTLLVDDFDKPNGLCFSSDESRLFVNDTDRAHIRVFEVAPDGTLGGGQVWAELAGRGEGVADGMKIDRDGNLYCCGPGGIHVFAPDATCLGVIGFPEKVANFTWGGANRRTLFVTASTSLYTHDMPIPGGSER
ncbi:MAG TPA: SMP-30/gluconolactonase/LRE family protein [Roseiflexaceae bacterium]|nr:SMP-30/gluconolactonase/LRE family protein [Roseiflexaceae bacterium]